MYESGSRWKTAAYVDPHHTSHTLTDLIDGHEYKVRVRAENPDGVGPPRTFKDRVIPKPISSKSINI